MHVLLVENDPRDQEILSRALQDLGARVTAVASDVDAYAAINSGGPFDVLVADLNLGAGTTGFDVARSARIRWPHVPVAYVTGLDIATEPHAVPGSVSFAKPMRLATLARDILDFARREGLGGGKGDAGRSSEHGPPDLGPPTALHR